MAEVKLFGSYISPYSLRVELALKLKGVEYEFVEVDLKNKSPLLLKYNPVHKKIPVLVHNGKAIAESLVILEYIDETWGGGPSLLPADPYERAKVRFWSRFLDDKCEATIRKACLSSGEEQEKAKEEFSGQLQFLEKELNDKKFFGGDTIGLVDIAATFLGYWFPIVAQLVGIKILHEDSYPNLCKWIEEYTNSSLMKENAPPKDKLTEHIKAFIKSATSTSE